MRRQNARELASTCRQKVCKDPVSYNPTSAVAVSSNRPPRLNCQVWQCITSDVVYMHPLHMHARSFWEERMHWYQLEANRRDARFTKLKTQVLTVNSFRLAQLSGFVRCISQAPHVRSSPSKWPLLRWITWGSPANHKYTGTQNTWKAELEPSKEALKRPS